MLSEDKYAPGDTSRWKHVSARFPALYQALLDEPDKAVRKSMYGVAVKRRVKTDGHLYVEYVLEEWRERTRH